jgi:hypothetical protein
MLVAWRRGGAATLLEKGKGNTRDGRRTKKMRSGTKQVLAAAFYVSAPRCYPHHTSTSFPECLFLFLPWIAHHTTRMHRSSDAQPDDGTARAVAAAAQSKMQDDRIKRQTSIISIRYRKASEQKGGRTASSEACSWLLLLLLCTVALSLSLARPISCRYHCTGTHI